MPIADTELLFALNPRDPKHRYALNCLKEIADLVVPDTAILEFQIVLRSRGRSLLQVRKALLAIHEILASYGVREVKTINSTMLALQCEIEETHKLSYFDSLIAASALTLDCKIVSDNKDFDEVSELKRIPLSKNRFKP